VLVVDPNVVRPDHATIRRMEKIIKSIGEVICCDNIIIPMVHTIGSSVDKNSTISDVQASDNIPREETVVIGTRSIHS
jgi:hypothetical protein